MSNKIKSSGFIRLIVIIVIVVILLAYFNVNLKEILSSDAGQDNLQFLKGLGEKAWGGLVYLWTNFIREPATWIWENWILGWLWPLVSNWVESQKTT
ncbi:MAG: hypothetical protein AAB821_00870 [Patescibacteria group bacterium]